MAEYNPESPNLTLYGFFADPSNKDKYGINDETGLGPNGSDAYISYDVVINTISTQNIGDASVRKSSGLAVGGSYNGQDIKVGDWVATRDGLRVWQITEITQKGDTYVSCSIEDVGMNMARTRSDRANNPVGGAGIVVFEVNDNNVPLFASNQTDQITVNNGLDLINGYFATYEPFQRFTFYPDITGSVEIGDLVTITGSIDGSPVSPYRLIPASEEDTVIGIVSDIYGGNNINVRPYNKIITNFSKPELLTDGIISSTWYLSGSDGAYTTSSDFGDPKFFQLSNAIGTSTTGSFDGPSLDETTYNLIINNIEVIPVDAGGSTLNIGQITSSINDYSGSTFVTASINEQGGVATITSGDSAGTGGEDGSYGYSGQPIELFAVLDGSNGTPGSYPSAPGKFAITASGYEMVIHPTQSSDTVYDSFGGYPGAMAVDIKAAIDSASAATGADLTVTVVDNNTLTLTVNDGTDLEIEEISNDSFARALVGLSSGTALPTGQFVAPSLEQYLALERTDGGDILLQGTWTTRPEATGLTSVSGTPPYLLMIEAAGGSLETFYTGSSVNTNTSKINFSGSGVEVTLSGSDGVLVNIDDRIPVSQSDAGVGLSTAFNFSGSLVQSVTIGTSGVATVYIDGDAAGTSGTSGTAAGSGTSGTDGSSGTSGIGTTGTSGTSGDGDNGTSGIAGADGTSGTSGESGTTGTSGSTGTSGFSGFDGSSGTVGTSGTANGSSGTSGTTGSAGTSGTSGDVASATSGTDGVSGTSGTSGNSSTSGTAGTAGTSGSTGTDGTAGSSGTAGNSSTSGTSDTSGTAGSSGSSGTTGNDGTTGTAGDSGTSGTSDTSGTTGTAGSSGTSGAASLGTSGTDGISGTSGTSGAKFNIRYRR
jgi:hypothetical protein